MQWVAEKLAVWQICYRRTEIFRKKSDRNFVQTFWGGTNISSKPGYTATEMFEALK
jgi:hypothetical protein